MFEKIKEIFKPDKSVAEEKQPPRIQLKDVFSTLDKSPEILDLVKKELFERNPEKFKSLKDVEKALKEAKNKNYPLEIAKLVERSLGEETLRKLALLRKGADIPKDLFKILRKDFEKTSFEKQIEKGFYTGYMENYGVEWNLEKVARDSWQNFFDANSGTLDGIKLSEEIQGESNRIIISGDQKYDWRMLRHTGASYKPDIERAVGGFGEGTKVYSLVLLRDFGAKEVKFSCDDWAINFYLDRIPPEQVPPEIKEKNPQGLFIKKHKLDKPLKGNKVEIIFSGEKSQERTEAIIKARELFYSSENPDFQGASYDNKETGGFKILSPIEKGEYIKYKHRQEGHFYINGQRTHYESRDKWEKVRDINLWVWKSILPKDRDRGMVTRTEMKERVIPFIVDSMKEKQMKESVYDFKPLWDKVQMWEEGHDILKRITENLAKKEIKLEFEREYLADDLGFSGMWITSLLQSQGYEICRKFMADIGMNKVSEKFKDLQQHFKVEASPEETQKTEILKRAAKEIGLEENDIKDVWIFSEEDEKNIFSGQYNDMFFWISRETLTNEFQKVFDVYLHEAAHKKGPDGSPQFTYELDRLNSKCREFIKNNLNRFKEFEKEWEELLKEKK